MYWINADQLRNSEEQDDHRIQQQNARIPKPTKRWGQSCVEANNKLYIIGGYEGQYLGDVWEFDFQTMQYTQIPLEGQDAQLLSRSNHTAVYYNKTNSIYVFGGGHTQRQRFNDTIKLEFMEQPSTVRGQPPQKYLKVEKLQLAENSPLPSARTYHASCLLDKYMIVIGGESNSDLADLWALDLEQRIWYKPEINFKDAFTPKRFHTVSALNETQVITFGGCHSEYVHMNEMHVFDLADFFTNPSELENRVECTQIKVQQGIPSTRWGHAASTYQQKLYIIGGRNDKDVNDIHEFDYKKMKWKELELQGPLPAPRRRHSALFISGSIVLFGGFDGNFYDDLHVLDFQTYRKQIINILPSSINMDYRGLVGEQEKSDVTFILNIIQNDQLIEKLTYMKSGLNQRIYAHKPLLLFRLVEREIMNHEENNHYRLDQLIAQGKVCEFIKNVYEAKQGQEISLVNVNCKTSFLKLLEYLYCDRFVDSTTTTMVRNVAEICKQLNLTHTYLILKKKADFASLKIKQGVEQELQLRSPNNEPLQLSKSQQQLIKSKVEQLESQVKLDFSHIEDMQVLSPEDRQERLHNKALHLMNQCRNLDEFFDVLFLVEDTLIKANSLVLSARCPYFKSMLSRSYSFRESKVDRNGFIKVQGVPKLYFSCIIQYIYSDHFYIQKHDAEFFVKLMIYADYFSLPRLVDICSSYLKPYVNAKSAILLFLLAHAHNATQLEKYCINYIAMNEFEIMNSRHFRNFKRQAQSSLIEVFFDRLNEEKQESFVQIKIQNFINKKNNTLIEQQYGNEQIPSSNPNDLPKRSTTRQLSQGAQQKNLPFNNHSKIKNTNIKEDEEVESKLLDLLNNAPYIYLEEHQKYETYFQMPSNLIAQKLAQIEEIKENAGEFNKFNSKNKYQASQFILDKENMNPNTVKQSSKCKFANLQKNMLSDNSMSSNNMDSNQFVRRKDSKRLPLKDLNDQNVDDNLYDDNQSDYDNFSTMACSNNFSNNFNQNENEQNKNQQPIFIPRRSQFYVESNVDNQFDSDNNNQ